LPSSTPTLIRSLAILLLLALLVGCSDTDASGDASVNSESGEVVITNPKDLDKHVGKTVVIRGELHRLKLPSVLGVDLSFNDIESDDTFGKQVECTGKLQREVVTDAPPEAARGNGTYYALIDVSKDEPVTVKIIE